MPILRSSRMRALVPVLAAAACLLNAQAADPLLHKPAPAFARTDLNRQPIDLASYRGKVVLLNFWATWCAPCLIEIPRFVEWQTRYGPEGLQVIGVSMDDDPEAAAALTRERHVNYPIIMGDAQLGTAYGGILGLPVSFLIDRRGTIAARYKGETSLDAMERGIQRLMGERVTQ